MARILIPVFMATLLVGCAHEQRICHYSRDITLSGVQELALGTQHVRLVSVAPGGSTTIELVPAGQKLTATPGDFFVSEVFGTQGLQLLSVSPDTNEVVLRQRWADTK
jgi:hypothetical protein